MSDVEHVMVRARLYGAHAVVVCELVRLLIESGSLNQGATIARFERLSREMMEGGNKEAMQLADIVRDAAAGEQERKPS